jgi:HAD superfamily phosphoserine phosphatase-like hydrolase
MRVTDVTVVLDFDGTLISKDYVSLYNQVERTAMTPEGLEAGRLLRDKYIGRMHDRQLTNEEELEWSAESLQLYIADGLTTAKTESALKHVRLRPGVVDCLNWLKSLEIPVAVVSFGVVQFIEPILRRCGITHLVDQIYASYLTANRNGRFVGYLPGSLVVPSNKDVFCRQFADRHGRPFSAQLAIGDSSADVLLGPSQENRFGIAKDEADRDKLRKFMCDAAVTEGFHPAVEWLMRRVYPVRHLIG